MHYFPMGFPSRQANEFAEYGGRSSFWPLPFLGGESSTASTIARSSLRKRDCPRFRMS